MGKLDSHEIAYFAVRGTDRDPVDDVEVVRKMIDEHADQREIETIEFLKEKDPFKHEKNPHDGKAGYWYAIHNLMFRKK